MKYAARIFAIGMLLFLTEEIAYEAGSDLAERAVKKISSNKRVDAYEEQLDYTTLRVTPQRKIRWLFHNVEIDMKDAWCPISFHSMMGLTETALKEMLSVCEIPKFWKDNGAEAFQLDAFTKEEIVISIKTIKMP